MRTKAVVFLSFLITLAFACKRQNEVTVKQPAPKTVAQNQPQDMSTADTTLEIVPIRPVFVKSVDVTSSGTENFATGNLIELAPKQPMTITAHMNKFPDGLMLRYSIAPQGDDKKPIAEERKAPDAQTLTTTFNVPPLEAKRGDFALKVWAGGDLVYNKPLRFKK